jgi:hypothetical protein
MKKLFAAVLGAGLVLGAAPAFAGEWRLDARRCADLREDWRDARENHRDERVTYGRRDRVEDRYDRREDRHDRAVTVCPRSAFVYVSDRRDDRRDNWRDDRRGYGNDRDYDKRGKGYGNASYDRRDAYRAPPMKLRYDRRMRMQYTYDHGRKIYVRG